MREERRGRDEGGKAHRRITRMRGGLSVGIRVGRGGYRGRIEGSGCNPLLPSEA